MPKFVCSECGFTSEAPLSTCPDCKVRFQNYEKIDRRQRAGSLSALFILVGGILGAIFSSKMGLEKPAAIFLGCLLGPLVAYPIILFILWIKR